METTEATVPSKCCFSRSNVVAVETLRFTSSESMGIDVTGTPADDTENAHADSGAVDDTSVSRRSFLGRIGLGAGTVVVVAGAGVVGYQVFGTGGAHPGSGDPDEPGPTSTSAPAVLGEHLENNQPGGLPYGSLIAPGVDTSALQPFVDRGIVQPATAYAVGDMVVLTNGFQVVFKTAATSTGGSFVSASSYFVVAFHTMRFAWNFGYRADGSQSSKSTNRAALQAAITSCNPTDIGGSGGGTNGVGAIVMVPAGNAYIDGTIDIPSGVVVIGQGRLGSTISLADGANCTMLATHVSSDGITNPNAMFVSLRDFGLDCRATAQGVTFSDGTLVSGSTRISSPSHSFIDGEYLLGPGILPDTRVVTASGSSATMSAPAQQTITGNAFVMGGLDTQIYGIACATNPLTTPASADFGHDPSHNVERVVIRNARDAAIKLTGRSDIRLSGIVIEQSWGVGIDTTFDTTIANSFIGFTAWDGIRLGGSSCRISNTKTYNTGQRVGGGGKFNLAPGISAAGVSGITITGHDAQQCTGSAFRFTNCRAINVDGVASQPGFQGVASDGSTYNAMAGTYGLELDTVTASIFHVVGLANPGGRAYRVVRSDGNEIHITHVGSGTSVQGPTESTDTVRAGNEIHVNGQATAAVSYGGMYGRVTTEGLWYCPGIQEVANITPTQNVVHLVPVPLARPGVAVVELSLRVVKAGSAGAVLRLGYYTSDLSGNDTFLLAAELPVIDATVVDVHRRALPLPLAISGRVVWLACVSQGGPATAPILQAIQGALVAGTSANPISLVGYIANNVTGALPATLFGPGVNVVGVGKAPAMSVRLSG